MSKVEKQLKSATDLAKEYRAYSRERYGWSTQEMYDDNSPLRVRCYFAGSGDHTDVSFYWGSSEVLGIGFFTPEHYDIKMRLLPLFDELLDAASTHLKTLKEEYEQEEKTKRVELKEKRKATLKRELEELEAEVSSHVSQESKDNNE